MMIFYNRIKLVFYILVISRLCGIGLYLRSKNDEELDIYVSGTDQKVTEFIEKFQRQLIDAGAYANCYHINIHRGENSAIS